ncbi:molecular chaperone DnaJ [Isoptericola sp. CG 20/1183]|uniref:Molecular chaperone DnaJ n=1 Tax=Isoptericola halotolerans TaxID=300560 RepID=A0ABX5ECE4_9MICO|nr:MULTISPECIES: DnaJ C-terminal domain-containing protein [Isoptericola]PRZ03054.1 molecular chaperone DnaJ [Isoptericola sp. CG 20/1183]PRZ03308.1 molecular chaperone DnaJ [Isoptericola halotolerans]
MTGQDWIEKDFYAALGVPKDADQAAIKKAYRKLARQYHPDQNPGDASAESRFKEIGEAYSVLSDSEQRQQYDAVRSMAGGGARFNAGPGGASGGFEDVFSSMFGGAGGARPGARPQYQQYQSGGAGFEDILGSMFGGSMGGGRPAGFGGPQQRKGADVETRATLPFRAAVEGTTVELTVDGKKITARIPAGVHDGQKIRLRGKGRPGSAGGPAGDLLIVVHVTEHPVFSIDGANLRMTLPVTFAEAALGTTVEVPTMSGETVRLKVPSGTPSGRVLRVKGRGVATTKRTGDLLVTVQVVVPQKLSRAAKKALEDFAAEADGEDVRAELAAKAAQ